MEFKYKSIPKHAHLYVGFEKLSYLRYLTVFSLASLNPDWTITLYKPKKISKNITWETGENARFYNKTCYYHKIETLKNTNLIEFNFDSINVSNSIPEVHKSDFLRWHLLSKLGGLWCDIDILFFKPLSCLNTLGGETSECFYCYNGTYHSIGFNLSAPNNNFYTQCRNASNISYDQYGYQSVGRYLLESNHHLIDTNKSINIPMDIVYAFDSNNIQNIYDNQVNLLTNQSIGIHWYGGSPISYNFESSINEKNFLNYNNILTNKFIEYLAQYV